jgi:uncharacterized protein YkwD
MARAALAACGPGDAGLGRTAQAIAERKLRGSPIPDADAIAALQRAAGEPHPWARAWAATGTALDAPALLDSLQRWVTARDPSVRDPRSPSGPLSSSMRDPLRRCGTAEARSPSGARALVVVVADALADLTAIPTRARVGQWLTVEARMHVPATGGRVIVLGPDGSPHAVPTSFEGGMLRARFGAQPGETTVQVVADVAGGPRPVLEATVFTDTPPAPEAAAAPGEDAAAGAGDEEHLAAMIAAARAWTGLPSLARDPRLDGVARAHAARMLATHRLSHDLGDGDPMDRMRSAGVDAREAGENVAHAATLELAHRATWLSPSHRANLLGRFARVGVAVVRDTTGDAWIVEELAR